VSGERGEKRFTGEELAGNSGRKTNREENKGARAVKKEICRGGNGGEKITGKMSEEQFGKAR